MIIGGFSGQCPNPYRPVSRGWVAKWLQPDKREAPTVILYEEGEYRGFLAGVDSGLPVSYRSRALKSTSPPMNPVGLPSSGQKHQTVMLASPLPWRSQSSTSGMPPSSVR